MNKWIFCDLLVSQAQYLLKPSSDHSFRVKNFLAQKINSLGKGVFCSYVEGWAPGQHVKLFVFQQPLKTFPLSQQIAHPVYSTS